MKKYFTRENVRIALTVALHLGLLFICLPPCFDSDTGWVVPFFAFVCWCAGSTFRRDLSPLICKLLSRLHKNPTT